MTVLQKSVERCEACGRFGAVKGQFGLFGTHPCTMYLCPACLDVMDRENAERRRRDYLRGWDACLTMGACPASGPARQGWLDCQEGKALPAQVSLDK